MVETFHWSSAFPLEFLGGNDELKVIRKRHTETSIALA